MSAPTESVEWPRRGRPMIVLAHGAGGSMNDPLLVDLSVALVARGFGVARFNFRYRDEGRKIPDRAPVLEATFMEELESLRAAPPASPFAGSSVASRWADAWRAT